MPVSDLCSRNLVCVEKGASLQYAAQLMMYHSINGKKISQGKSDFQAQRSQSGSRGLES